MNVGKITSLIKEIPTSIKKTSFAKLKTGLTADVCEFSSSAQKTKKANPLKK